MAKGLRDDAEKREREREGQGKHKGNIKSLVSGRLIHCTAISSIVQISNHQLPTISFIF